MIAENWRTHFTMKLPPWLIALFTTTLLPAAEPTRMTVVDYFVRLSWKGYFEVRPERLLRILKEENCGVVDVQNGFLSFTGMVLDERCRLMTHDDIAPRAGHTPRPQDQVGGGGDVRFCQADDRPTTALSRRGIGIACAKASLRASAGTCTASGQQTGFAIRRAKLSRS